MTSEIKWGVWCEVWGGVTGTRVGWLKSHGHQLAKFTTREEAQAEATRLLSNLNHHRTAEFRYTARRLDGGQDAVR